ncbi:MAG: DNA polymerase III subunit delta' [Thermodesulfobacteriota bacterium]
MTLDEIQGQERAIGLLRRALAANRLAHAFVFAGPAGVGKRAAAFALARAVLCTDAPGSGCGRCIECHLVSAGTHPDVVVEDLASAQAERATASFVSIDQVRRVSAALALRPVRGARKLGIIDQAERLTQDAQNALLKTLEEPRGQATLVLVSTNLDALLPTIRSRCQRLLFAPLGDDLVAALLEGSGVEPDVARRAAALAGGSLDRARELASTEGWARAEELRARLERAGRLSIPERLDLAAELSPRGERNRGLQALTTATLLELFRARMVAAASAAPPGADGGPGEDDPFVRLAPVRRAREQLAQAYATVRDLERNANANLAWDKLLLQLGERDRA